MSLLLVDEQVGAVDVGDELLRRAFDLVSHGHQWVQNASLHGLTARLASGSNVAHAVVESGPATGARPMMCSSWCRQ